jgi:putative peptidoglycan lipid II flippase
MNEIVRETTLEQPAYRVSDKQSITIGAIIQAAFTLLSRIFGMVRDVMVSNIFGAGAISDAFIAAFTIPNVLRQFFGEGAFSVAFVPIYVSTKEKSGDKAATAFFQDAFGLLCVTLSLVTIVGMVFSENLVLLFAYGFRDNASQLALAETMTRWLFPYVLMVSVVALFGAYLACYKRFAAMAFAPVLLNITMIIFMVLWIDAFDPPVMVLVAGVFIGGLLQVALMMAVLARFGMWAWPQFSIKTEAMKQFLRMLGPALFGVFVYQLNIIVLRQLASLLGDGQITYYYNADRLAQFATGVFAVSIATAALPELSRGIAKYGHDAFFETLRFTLVLTSFILTPCAFGLMVFAHPVISVLFVHGAFTDADAIITAKTLMAFSPSLIAFGWSRPLIQAFYAQSDTKTPVLVGIVTVLLNLSLGWLLLRFEVVGLAMTLSISSFMQFFILLFLFKRKSMQAFKTKLVRPFLAHAGVSTIACGVGLWVAQFGDWHQGFTIRNGLVLGVLSAMASGAYFLFAYYFKLNEARKFIDGIRARIFK